MKTTRGTLIGPLINPTTLSKAGAFNLAGDAASSCVAVSINGGPYVCLVAVDAAMLDAADVYIDAVNGSDSNDGLTDTTALQTWAEYARRIQDGPVTATPWQTVHLLSDIPETITIDADYVNGLVIEGQRTVVASNSVTAATAWDTAVDPVVPGSITAAVANLFPLSRMFVMTSGANVGKIGYLLQSDDGQTAQISHLIDVDTFATGDPAIGDTFDIVTLTQVDGIRYLESGTGFVNPLNITAPTFGGGDLEARTSEWFHQACIWVGIEGGTASFRQVNGDVVGCHFEEFRPRYVDCDLSFFTCSFRDCNAQLRRSQFTFFGINPYAYENQTSPPWFIGDSALVSVSGGSLGVLGFDNAGGPNAIWDVRPGGSLTAFAGGRFWTVGQTQGEAVRVNTFALASWPSGSTCATFYSFDDSGAADEFNLGGTITDAATLAFIGTINAANNAAAVPQIA